MSDDAFATRPWPKTARAGKVGRRSMNDFKTKQWRNATSAERNYPSQAGALRIAKIAIASSNLALGRKGACTVALLDGLQKASVEGARLTGGGARQQHEPALSLSARLLQAQDEERRRISRELHDTVGQSLFVVLMNLETLSRTVRDKTLEETIDLVKHVSREVRTVSYLMHPPVLDLSGLEAAINWYAEGFSKRSGIKTEVDSVQELPRLPIEKETALYRIVQECLTNVHRYSGASKAWIRIEVNEAQLRLEVEDNGKGLATEDVHVKRDTPPTLGVGIPGMRERMRELGGSLRIQSSKHGTKVTAALPLTAGTKEVAANSKALDDMSSEITADRMNDAANGCFDNPC